MNSERIPEPNLAKPGAGLPFFEWAAAKYFLFPSLFRSTTKEQAIEHFAKETEKISALAAQLTPQMLVERRLIPRLRELEDSSRYWSVAMSLEHLIIVGAMMRQIVVELSSGGTTLKQVTIAEVKPSTDVDAAGILQSFTDMADRFVRETSGADIDAFPYVTYPHPWFGPLNASKWLKFAAPHQRIHRKQIEAIIIRL